MINVGRPIEGISLNGLEWLLEEDNVTPMEFDSKEVAIEFLQSNGVELSEEEIDDSFRFLDVDTEEYV